MTIGTWNVNGIRARQSQLQEWVRRDRPDIVCLQEIKAGSDQVPTALCEMEDYWCYWHGAKGYSGVGLHVSKTFSADRPVFAHPAFDYESRIVTTEIAGVTVASVYVPNGGKDFDAKMRFLQAMDDFVVQAHSAGKRLVICGDINIARADIDVHPKERKPRAIGQLPEERAILERLLERGLVDTGRALDPDERPDVHLVGAVAEHAPAQYRMAARLHPGKPVGFRSCGELQRGPRLRHERSRARGCTLRRLTAA